MSDEATEEEVCKLLQEVGIPTRVIIANWSRAVPGYQVPGTGYVYPGTVYPGTRVARYPG
eukprot:3138805-Rhodomonas_salina.1